MDVARLRQDEAARNRQLLDALARCERREPLGQVRGLAVGLRGARAHAAASASLRATRSLADFARGFWATSPWVATTARGVKTSASGVRPQTQIGRSGGQMQPRARSAMKRFARRSSSEWNEMT